MPRQKIDKGKHTIRLPAPHMEPFGYSEDEFEHEVSLALLNSGFKVVSNPLVGGLRPDFVVIGPGNRFVVVEAKSWLPTEDNERRALQQAQLYKSATGAESAFVVLPASKMADPARGLLSKEMVVPAIQAVFRTAAPIGSPRGEKPTLSKSKKKMIFAAMPFDGKYDDAFFVGVAGAAKELQAEAKRVDKEQFSGDIVAKIKELIENSAAVVADLSESKPNVLYEVGYAHALHRPTVHICSTPLDKLPFDVAHDNTKPYVQGQTHKLAKLLVKMLKAENVRWQG